ncbi:hypothetical protein [Rhodohalobacter sp. 8-1]|uniref:hypothetical protein n=1 Tax=Rhodohalobacter sp. 8-1 TaxID=3131972 RepID=UPI0030EB7BA5
MSRLNNNDLNDLLRQFLDGELNPKQERNALKRIAENDEMREQLRFEQYVSKTLRGKFDAKSFSVPEGFSDDVMSEIAQLEGTAERNPSWIEKVKQQLNSLLTPREYSFRPATIFAVPALLLILFTGLYQSMLLKPAQSIEYSAGTQVVSGEASEEVWIRFVYIDEEANQIAVAGNFSDWEPIELDSRKMGDRTVWTGLVPVKRGEHRYMFVRNGEEWISDPLAEIQRDDGFGNKNAVIYL